MHVLCPASGLVLFCGGSYYSIYYWHRGKDSSEEVIGQGMACVVVLQGVCCHPRGGGSACFFASLSLSCPYPPPGKEEEEDTTDDDDENDNQTDGRDVFICIRDYY